MKFNVHQYRDGIVQLDQVGGDMVLTFEVDEVWVNSAPVDHDVFTVELDGELTIDQATDHIDLFALDEDAIEVVDYGE